MRSARPIHHAGGCQKEEAGQRGPAQTASHVEGHLLGRDSHAEWAPSE
jgi:hypothetical protein